MEGDNKALQISALSLGLLIFGAACIATELFWARKPLIPVHLLLKELGLYCLIQFLFHSGRTALVVNIIPYFIRVEGASDFLSSMMYVQVAVGVSVGGVISSLIIKRCVVLDMFSTDIGLDINSTGRYKTMAVVSLIITILSFLLIFLSWRDGCTLWESSILFFVGLAPGILFSSLFIGMSNSSATDCIASCIGTFYLSQQLGIIVGSACGSALIQGLFKMNLAAQMEGTSYWKDIPNILNDVKFSQTLPPPEQELVKSSYLASFQYVPVFAAATTLTTLPIFLCLKEKRLE
ncbi:uncharacterized protein LDX57_005221 [Aspergillus melleus]|uniref:uncharacterized protein n=1 Tax=Aspergillus melleus TaxID=138277 RepID=UPI001E8DA778|nr:uncharacterized protein LDX57_005221 [Aspergillus melleus]KAH8427508.1 hypothetical protein LDX57_005221 [Aspergillus melleus]